APVTAPQRRVGVRAQSLRAPAIGPLTRSTGCAPETFGHATSPIVDGIARRYAAQVARIFRVVVGSAAVQRATVVPDHQIAHVPAGLIDDLALGSMLHQIA